MKAKYKLAPYPEQRKNHKRKKCEKVIRDDDFVATDDGGNSGNYKEDKGLHKSLKVKKKKYRPLKTH